jgi:hypothetical protein
MEDVLDLYCRPYDPSFPVVGMDEQPVQLVSETRLPLRVRPGRRRRVDYEYRRAGTASVFMFSEPLGSWRRASARRRRTSVDWAKEVRILLEEDYPHAEKVILVVDNLNTHKIASLYEAFPPELARSLAERLEIHYTPKHGSWLNVAECELSVMSRDCLRNRTPDIATLRRKINPWNRRRNRNQRGIDWRFSTDDARIKLKRLYPEVQMS